MAAPELVWPRVEPAFRDCVATPYRYAAVERSIQKPAPNGAKELYRSLHK